MIVQIDGHMVGTYKIEQSVDANDCLIVDFLKSVPEVVNSLNGRNITDHVYVKDVVLNLITKPTLKFVPND